MTDESVVAIARIPLARAPLRVLVGPIVLIVVGLLGAAAGWLLLPDPLRLLAAPAAVGVIALALVLAVRILSVRLEVEVSTLRVRRVGADLRFTLVRGAVTRVSLEGENAVRLRQRLGPFGWGAGQATLRGEETIHVVRLAPTPSLIIVPTDGGRVGIAPASEEQLLTALAAAARVQQRLDQVAARARSLPLDRLVEPPRPAPPPPDPRRVLTGIERVQLEQRLAAERAAALAAAEAERRLAAEQAARAAAEAEQRAAVAAMVAHERPSPARRPALPRPSLPRPQVALPRPHVALPRPHLTLPRPRVALPPTGRLPEEDAGRYLIAVVPLLVAVLVWAFATVSGRLPVEEEQARLVGLTLALGGPAAALGVLAARAWFPRLLGLVAVTAVCTLVLAGRALLG